MASAYTLSGNKLLILNDVSRPTEGGYVDAKRNALLATVQLYAEGIGISHYS